MPLKSGSSQKTVSSNIQEIVEDWQQDGTIGNSRPKTKQAAVKQAVAISLQKAGKSNQKTPAGKTKTPAKKPTTNK